MSELADAFRDANKKIKEFSKEFNRGNAIDLARQRCKNKKCCGEPVIVGNSVVVRNDGTFVGVFDTTDRWGVFTKWQCSYHPYHNGTVLMTTDEDL